jgi:hypothetical protein
LIANAVRFAVAMQGAGFGDELNRWAKALPNLMAELEDARKLAHAAIMSELRPEPTQPPKRVGFYIGDEKDRFFPAFIEPGDVEQFVEDTLSVLLHLPRSTKYALQLLRWKPDGHVRAFSESLWKLWRRAEREHLWGCFLVAQCRAAGDPEQLRNLIVSFASMPEVFRAIQDAAESVFIGLPVAPAVVGAKPAEAVPVLSQRQYYILQAMLRLGATSPDTLRTTIEIAKKADPDADPDAFKEPIADLKKRNFIATKEGRGGGCWLTPEGLTLARHLGRKQ